MIKKLTTILFIILFTTGFGKVVHAQSLYFCEGVDENGKPVNESNTFTIPSDGGYLYFLVKLPEEVNCTTVKYKLYKIVGSGEEYSTTIYQEDMKSNWTWFWKQVTFYQSGDYNVYVVDCKGVTLASAKVKIQFSDD
jgi:hypothetical protein